MSSIPLEMDRVRLLRKQTVEVERVSLDIDLAPENVLVRVHACAICGTDISHFKTGMSFSGHVPGHEFSGTVLQAGSAVEGFSAGDRVTCLPILYCGKCRYCLRGAFNLCSDGAFLTDVMDGAMATHVVVPAYTLRRIPMELDMDDAALIEPLAVAVHACRAFGDLHGRRVAVVGAGALGLLVIQTARALGAAHIACLAKYPRQQEMARQLGADLVVSGTTIPEDLARSADLSIDSAGGRGGAILQAFKFVRRGATVIAAGTYQGLTGLDLWALARNEVTLRGIFCYSSREGEEDDMSVALSLASSGAVSLNALITHTFPLARAADAFATAAAKDTTGSVRVLLKNE